MFGVEPFMAVSFMDMEEEVFAPEPPPPVPALIEPKFCEFLFETADLGTPGTREDLLVAVSPQSVAILGALPAVPVPEISQTGQGAAREDTVVVPLPKNSVIPPTSLTRITL